MNKTTIRIIVKSLLFLALAGFIFPFATVSCSIGTEPATASGYEMAIGRFFNDALDTSQSAQPNLLVLASVLLTVVALVFAIVTFARKKPLPRICVGIFSILSSLLLIAASLTLGSYYELSEEHMEIVTFQVRYGLYLTAILQLSAGVCSFLVPSEKDEVEAEIDAAISQAENE